MSLMHWDPFSDMAHLREQVNRLFEQSLTHAGHELTSAQTWTPSVDIFETENAIVLRVELAGVKPEDIDIQIAGDTLTVKGERVLEKGEKRQYVRLERNYGAFQRSFTLGLPIDQQQVRAAYRDGVLEISLPKAEQAKPKTVKVEVNSGAAAHLIDADY